MNRRVIVSVRDGVVENVIGAEDYIVLDFDSYESGDPIECPVCGREILVDEDGEAGFYSIALRGACPECASEGEEDDFSEEF